MNAFLSSISGGFGRALMIGMVAPAAIFVLLAALALDPLISGQWWDFGRLFNLEEGWTLALALLGVLALALLLYNLNTHLLRLYAGYSFQSTALGAWLARRAGEQAERVRQQRRRLQRLEKLQAGLPEAGQAALRSAWTGSGEPGEAIRAAFAQAWLAKNRLPGRPQPTRLGNILYAAEEYSTRQYDMEAVLFWPHLLSVMDESFAGLLEDAKAQLDFMLNASFLSTLLAGAVAAAGVLLPNGAAVERAVLGQGGWGHAALWFGEVALFSLLGYLCYRLALLKADNYGNLIRTAFDLYRLPLLQKLGYQAGNASAEYEKALWHRMADRILYGSGTFEERPAQDAAGLLTYCESSQPLRIGRSLRAGAGKAPTRIALELTNEGKKTADDFVIYDRLADGYGYAHGSARCSKGVVSASGRGMLRLAIRGAKLAAGETMEVSYQARKEAVE